MKNSIPIKMDSFRFITFRTPEQLTEKNKPLRFILHPDIKKSIIQSCPIPSGDETSIDIFKKYLATFKPFQTVQEVKDINPDLFNYSSNFHKERKGIPEIASIKITKEQLLTSDQEILLFDQLFYQAITKESKYIRQAITQLLVVNHIFKNAQELINIGVHKLTDIKIEIPTEVLDCFKPWSYSKCGGDLEGVNSLGIADFRRVEQEVCCYVPGEVSHVENIMAKEYKERSTRNYVRTEDTIETSRETEIENLTDVATTTRNEISSEIANVLEEDKSSNYGGSIGVSAEYFGASINVDAYADFATSSSSSYSNTEAKNYAEEVTKRALERIVQKTSEKRTSKVIKEFEENNKHGFDNRSGGDHVTGIYRWLDIIYTNRLVNYGKRLMVEFMIPEPAEFYKRILNYKKPEDPVNPDDIPDLPDPPKELSEFQINSPSDIDNLNAATAASYYGVSIDPLPANETTITKDLSPLAPVDHNRNINTQSLIGINVPTFYEADTIKGSYTYEYQANSWLGSRQAFCDFTFGGTIVYSEKDYAAQKQTKTVNINVNLNPNLSGTIPVSVGYSGCHGFYGAVNIKCILKALVITEWQNDAYNLLLAAYNQKLNDYNQTINNNPSNDPINNEEKQDKQYSPSMNRIIEQRELKRICIEMIMKPYCREQGKNNLTDLDNCENYLVPQVDQNKQFTDYANQVKFFEQAIDWKIMSYLFYPYYWADKCDWGDLMQRESNDFVFQAFLQSGMSRVVVPIRQQFTEAFLYYLETGDIWLGNDMIPGIESDLYLSIAEEMQTIEGVVEKEWETRVPTSLAIIQGKSAFLDQGGLPCCHKVENEETTSDIDESIITLSPLELIEAK